MIPAVAGTFFVLGLPGVFVAILFGLRLRALTTWAAIPLFSLAVVFILGEVTLVGHAPFGVPAFAILLVVLAGTAAVAVAWRRRAAGTDDHVRVIEHSSTRVLDAIDHGLLVAGIAFGSAVWARGLRGVPLVPPGGDAPHHGFFVERILSAHTIDPSKVVTSDARGLHAAAKYYPLALHASAAISTRLSGADVARVLLAYTLVFIVVVFPVGMFVLARALAPTRPLVGGFTALLVPLLAIFPYGPIAGGALPQIVGMALVPIAVLLVVRAATRPRSERGVSSGRVEALGASALAILCITALHTSELPVVALLAVLLVLEDAFVRRDLPGLGDALWQGALATGLALLLFAPTLVTFAHGVSERAPLVAFINPPQSIGGPARDLFLRLYYDPRRLAPRQDVLAFLTIVGAAIWLAWRRAAWVVGWIAVGVLCILSISPGHGLRYDLTFPWYHLESRVVPNLAFFVPVFAAVALASGVQAITTLLRRPRPTVAAIALGAAALVVIGIPIYRSETRYVRDSFDPSAKMIDNEALVGPTALRGFRWLHDHASPQDTVVNEPQLDGSSWMFPEYNVRPLIGVVFLDIPPELRDRFYLASHLQLVGRDSRVDSLARHYHARWVFFDAKVIAVAPRTLSLRVLQENPSMTPVFHDHGTWVFRIET